MLRPEALRRARWHQEQGHHLVVLSASLEAYLLPWGEYGLRSSTEHATGS
jgi:phosphoserine phosphatase